MTMAPQTSATGPTPEGMRVLRRVRLAYILFRLGVYALIWTTAAGALEDWRQHPLWFVSMTVLLASFAYARLKSAFTVAPTIEKKTLVMLRLSFLMGVGLAFLSAGRGWIPWAHNQTLLLIGGLPLIILGVSLLHRAQKALAPHYFEVVYVTAQQQCVDKEVYSHMRHPGYLGEYFITLGAVFMLNTLVGLMAVALLFGVAIMVRIHVEEKMLLDQLPGYDDYASRVKRFLVI